MLFLFLSTVWSRPNSSWLDQQKYTHPQLLPATLSNQDRAHFLDTAHQYLVQKYSSAHFACTNQSAVHYPFSKTTEELQKTYALETSVCIPNISWNEAYNLYMDADFRSQNMPGVEKAHKNKNSICITSQSFIGVMKPAYMCLDSIEKRFNTGVLLYSHLTDSKKGSFQPVYFQEEYILFEQMGPNTLIHRLSINRSRELGSAGTYILKKKSQEYPQHLIKAMKENQK
ncbi:MAG: hypothetical protein CL916_06695 [Deltaproteobacteria bacterium]|nr:hypothetical protein [Deltaproteobacteria bacterium]